ncbi:GntR family transcriptional regulator [Leucobacter sp. OLJS4]|uniref:GntR family transcriptional regulator n=1 Tax=unclassified Leucobacter TaxID=2621730 RepID=UPI000C17F71B|nr:MULTISPECIES: GntR family transcriptional regulator [unclassified Leucobacter]PIJ16279.1 GntR family transcriptional regulator [Leucobacter sp. OLES1]PII82531.1 GntR family transcriptional regulator [Leucobacter sp. OLCALW19]PII87286.1 GntR family transcriptional regulator [Leucobacter sp. OLTLW20]PII94658.1 GntR family transcriptional regulator [Leucobacter sp. OLAS13]PII98584.1 GntR family transcriptional regulator [Leucobacter sp. OLCS4]
MSAEPVWPEELFVDLDRNGPVPLYYQVSSRLEEAIRSGRIPAGARLENEISIGERLGLSRPTVRRAIQELVDKGMLVRRRGIGTQVVQGRVSRPVELTSLNEDLSRTGHAPTTEVLEVEREPASDEIAAQLGVEPGTEVTRIRRLRRADGTPMAILVNYLPPEFSDLTAEQLSERGLYEILRARGIAIRIANQTIGARRTHGDEAELLDIAKGSPLLTMDRVAFDHSGRAIEAGHHCYRPDLYSFETTVVAR